MSSRSFFIFDLDGTLALNDHRQHLLSSVPPNWEAFFEACHDDTPNWPVIDVARALASNGKRVEIWSGRSATVQGKTVEWLKKWGVPCKRLIMRVPGDYCPDEIVKKIWLDDARAEGRIPLLVFDDRQKVVDMWRAEGIACAQVAPGDF